MTAPHDCDYRVEADRVMRDYEALELDAGVMAEALDKIARGRRNRTFDPWAQQVAREALGYVSERTTSIVAYDEFMAWAMVQNG